MLIFDPSDKKLLEALLAFIYLGKVQVEQDQVEQFRRMLQEFKVMGHDLKMLLVEKKEQGKDNEREEGKQKVGESKGIEEGWEGMKQELESEEEMEDAKEEFEEDFEDEEEPEDQKSSFGSEAGILQQQFHKLPRDMEPDKKRALIAQVAAESPIKHTEEWLERKAARIFALTCKDCGYKARGFDRLETHISRFHLTEWPCDQCGLVLRSEGRLKKHIRCAHESLRSKGKCDAPGCDFVTPYMGQLNMHKRKEHGIGVQQHFCDECTYSTWMGSGLKRHKEAKHEGKRHQCDMCEANYPFPNGLKRHKEIMHEGKREQCPHCDYQATTRGNLKIHVNAKHEGIRFSCNQCSWSTTQEGALRIHVRTKHSQEEQFSPY